MSGSQQPLLWVNQQTFSAANASASFANTNALLWLAGHLQQPILHFWIAEKTVILGLQDSRLTNLEPALQTLKQAGFHYFLRNSGGLAVVADQAVLNVSLILPRTESLSVDAAYLLMVRLITASWPKLPIQQQLIPDSYCPGKFDLAVNQQKIAGIAQRRTSTATAIMAYISVSGDQDQRGQLLKKFYQVGQPQPTHNSIFPNIRPASMTTLAALGGPSTVATAINDLLQASQQLGYQADQVALKQLMLEPEFQAHLKHAQNQIALKQQQLTF